MDGSHLKDAQARAGRIAELLSADVPRERAEALADEIGGLVGASLMAAGVEPEHVGQLGRLVTGQEPNGAEAER
jgi:hypothetical protein